MAMTTSTVTLPSATPRRPRRRRVLLAGAAVLVLAGTASSVLGAAEPLGTTTDTVAGVREIVVAVDGGSVSLRGGAGPDVTVRTTRYGSTFREPDAHARLDGGVLTVEADCAGTFAGGCHVAEDLTVPPGVPVRVRTAAGAIEAVDLDVPRFDAETAAGAISASFVRPPSDVRVTSSAGSVVLRVPDAGYAVDAGTVAGSTRIAVVANPRAPRSLTVHTAAGNVAVLPRRTRHDVEGRAPAPAPKVA